MVGFFDVSNFYYFDTGKSTRTKPARIKFDDPVLFFDEHGKRMIPADEWEGTGMSLKGLIEIELKEVKEYMKVEHSLEDETIQELLDGAIDDVSIELNRGWKTEEEVPASIRTAIKQTTLSRYENRGEMTIPESAQGIINRYRFIPGT